METIQLAGNPPIEVYVRRSARSKRLSLRVGRTDGRVTVSMPRRTSLRQAEKFVHDQAEWITKHVTAAPRPKRPAIGETFPILGREMPIHTGKTRVARMGADALIVPDDPIRLGPRIKTLLQTLARTHLTEATDRYTTRIGRPMGKLTLRDTRSRWGSCTSNGDIMYSWRLIMAPWEVMDYVAAHEVSHLVHMDHSPRFWAQVESLLPNHQPYRQWLKTNGAALHGWDFSVLDAPPDDPHQ